MRINGLPATDNILVHCSTPLPDGTTTPCRPAIITGADKESIFATVFSPTLAPAMVVLKRKSANWHFATDCENLWE